jgi:hypothetical protein
MVGNGMEQASGYPWERLGDSVLVTFVSTFLRILADSVLKIREEVSLICRTISVTAKSKRTIYEEKNIFYIWSFLQSFVYCYTSPRTHHELNP